MVIYGIKWPLSRYRRLQLGTSILILPVLQIWYISLWYFLCHSFFKSPLQNESLVLSGADGIRFEQAMNFPHVEEPSESPAMAYKLCVCMPSGRLFAVSPQDGCPRTEDTQNPCKA